MQLIKKIWLWLMALLGVAPESGSATEKKSPVQNRDAQPANAGQRTEAADRAPVQPANSGGNQADQTKKAAESTPPVSEKPSRAPAREEAPAKPEKPWSIEDYKVPEKEGLTRFLDFDLDHNLLHSIADLGFEYCTDIQAEALPFTLKGQDLIGQAQTGTGKTAAFLITAIQKMRDNPVAEGERYASEPRVLALAPTRELALQIAKDAEQLTQYTGHTVAVTVGGMDYDRQRRQLRDEIVDILVATPGRLLDFLGSQDVFLDQLDLLIIDEADRMLDMGFIPDVKRIIRNCTPKEQRQTLLFSATFNQDVLNLASMWTQSAEFIEIEPEQKTAERVEQTVYMVGEQDKFAVLYNCLQKPEVEKAIIFANRRDETRKVEDRLRRRGIKTALLSGEIAQNKRLKTLDQFKKGQIQALVATDVAGRGIHVDDISHVFNYNLPENAEDYVHRIGRTGRAGQYGISISFASEDDAFTLPEIETYIGQKLECVIPDEDLLKPAPKADVPFKGQRKGGGGKPGGRKGGNRSSSRPRKAHS